MSAALAQELDRQARRTIANVDALAQDVLRDVAPALRRVRDDMQRELAAWLRSASPADRFSGLQRNQAMAALEGVIDRASGIAPVMADALRATRRATAPLAVSQLQTQVAKLGGMAPPDLSASGIAKRGELLLGRRHDRLAAGLGRGIGETISTQLGVGVAKGETMERLTTRLRKMGNPRAKAGPIDPDRAAAEIAEGLYRRAYRDARRIAITEAAHSYSTLQQEAARQANERRPDGSPAIVRRWDSTPDRARCERCRDMDGKTAPVDGEFPGGIKAPPLHPYCRCVAVAWSEAWTRAPKTEAAEAGFRIGVSSEIRGDDGVEPVAPVRPAIATRPSRPVQAPSAPAETLYRTPGAGPKFVASGKPAPLGFEAVWHDGTTLYRHGITGRYYTASQMAERDRDAYTIALAAPNVQRAGYETLEVKTARTSSEVRFRSLKTGRTYSADDLDSGGAGEQDDILTKPLKRAPAIVRAVRKLFGTRRR